MFILKALKSHSERDKIHFKERYDKQNLPLVIISYLIYETCQRLTSCISSEMTTPVRSPIH